MPTLSGSPWKADNASPERPAKTLDVRVEGITAGKAALRSATRRRDRLGRGRIEPDKMRPISNSTS